MIRCTKEEENIFKNKYDDTIINGGSMDDTQKVCVNNGCFDRFGETIKQAIAAFS